MSASLIEKLFKSKYGDWELPLSFSGPVVELVYRLEQFCQRYGLTLSRWQTNSTMRGHVERITWAVHTGPRPYRFDRFIADGREGDLVGYTYLNSAEGKSERCEAYKELSRLEKHVQAYLEQGGHLLP